MSKKHEFPVLIERDEDGVLIATVPALKGCHTHAKTMPVLMERVKEAILLCLEVEKDFPRLKFVGLQEVEVQTKMKLSPLSPAVVIKILKRLGFEPVRQRGSHIFFKHPDGRATVVPFHKGEDIPKGLIKKILQDIEVSWVHFIVNK